MQNNVTVAFNNWE